MKAPKDLKGKRQRPRVGKIPKRGKSTWYCQTTLTQQTILHEAVAHHGLRELFGHNVMDAFLDSVFAAASQEVKDAINELRRGNGWNFRTATEEYLAGLAERTDFERMTAEERGLFATIRRLFNHALEFLGLKNHELSDRELAYILWCSYQDLQRNYLLCKKL